MAFPSFYFINVFIFNFFKGGRWELGYWACI